MHIVSHGLSNPWNAAASAVWTLEGDQLILQVASAGYQRGERLPLHSSLAGEAITSRGPVVSNDVRTDPRFNRVDLARTQGWVRALVAPLLSSDNREPVGAVTVSSREKATAFVSSSSRFQLSNHRLAIRKPSVGPATSR